MGAGKPRPLGINRQEYRKSERRKVQTVKKLKKTLSLFLSFVRSLVASVFAADSDFTIENGVLTKYNGPGGDVVIPSGVSVIGAAALYGCASLTSVSILNSVTSIMDFALSSCTNLTSVTIPGSVTSIGQSIFYDCTSLTDVYYEGTQEQWEALSIYASVPDPAAVHYNSAAPAQPEQHEHHRRQRG